MRVRVHWTPRAAVAALVGGVRATQLKPVMLAEHYTPPISSCHFHSSPRLCLFLLLATLNRRPKFVKKIVLEPSRLQILIGLGPGPIR